MISEGFDGVSGLGFKVVFMAVFKLGDLGSKVGYEKG